MPKSKSKSKAKRLMSGAAGSGDQPPIPQRVNELVRRYGLSDSHPSGADPDSWLRRPELPDVSEILGRVGDGKDGGASSGSGDNGANDDEDDDDAEAVDVPVNNIDGPWGSREEYLRTHYELLREDVVAPLRDAVGLVRKTPGMVDNELACIYDKVHVTGYTLSSQGPAARVLFSTARAGKKILWEQSKRLLPGSLVALTPAHNRFRSVCKIAVIAARPLVGVQANPPEVDILFAKPAEVEVDPLGEWLMVEARTGYYEAVRHTLTGLQRLLHEKFPFADHLVGLQPKVDTPAYLQRNPRRDLTCLAKEPSEAKSLEIVHVLESFPEVLSTTLDKSQLQAVQRILTKRLAVIQGPPGTGKTHVSVTALKTMLKALSEGDPPIIVASQTNHALDQILRHIATFEDNFIRLGARTLDEDVVKKRTLYEVRRLERFAPITGSLRGPAQGQLRRLEESMSRLLEPLRDQAEPFSGEIFHAFGLLTESQRDSLDRGAKEWVQVDDGDRPSGSVAAWLGEEMIGVDYRNKQADLDLEYEEEDLEYEQLKEMEAEARVNDDDATDSLMGKFVPIAQRFTARPHHGLTTQAVEKVARTKDMWTIPRHLRGLVYLHLESKVKTVIRDRFREEACKYMKVVQELRIGRWEMDSVVLQRTKLIGMTTTGLSKYRPLIASLRPKVLLVEEAAETFEGLITTGCVESLEHLILVGDHKQLRGNCSVQELQGPPFNLGVSMFERLVNNKVEFTTLNCQRRMIPEIRKNLMAIYDVLTDHPSVLSRAPVPGMGGINSFFFAHFWPESRDQYFSCCNEEEANMLVGFVNYLIRNGVGASQITVLTLYNGQRKLIWKKLRTHPDLQGLFFNVRTVDSYQGEENAIILISLVRSNTHNHIGFLSDEHRICVALSRAKHGFYLFGDAVMLCKASRLWWSVVKTMAQKPRRVGFAFPLKCDTHGSRTWVREPDDWNGLQGGCPRNCGGHLPCGHPCGLKCHPFSHERMICRRKCSHVLSCGHQCQNLCSVKPCSCTCKKWTQKADEEKIVVGKTAVIQTKAGGRKGKQPLAGAATKGDRPTSRGGPQVPSDEALIDLSFPDESALHANGAAGTSVSAKDKQGDEPKNGVAKQKMRDDANGRKRWTDVVSWNARDGIAHEAGPSKEPKPKSKPSPPPPPVPAALAAEWPSLLD